MLHKLIGVRFLWLLNSMCKISFLLKRDICKVPSKYTKKFLRLLYEGLKTCLSIALRSIWHLCTSISFRSHALLNTYVIYTWQTTYR
jgi:hypothetical protein